MFLKLVDAGRDVLCAVLQHLLGDLVLIKGDDFLDGTDAEVQVFANGYDLADRNANPEDDLVTALVRRKRRATS